MAGRACVQRLQKEFRSLSKEPVPHVAARPSPNDILEWHFVLEGSEGTPFHGGVYHGKVKFPAEYPFKPPSISMITPNGRFATHKKICMSMSDFHPETWNPMWSVSSILTGLLSFMMDNTPTTGSISSTTEQKRQLARDSLAFNCKSPTFRKMFPEYYDMYVEKQKKASQQYKGEELRADLHTNDMADLGREATVKPMNKAAFKRFPMWLVAVLVALSFSVLSLPFLISNVSDMA